MRRVLLVGGPATLRARIAAEIDAGFDAAVDECHDATTALARLPGSHWDLFVVLPEAGRAPGLDLVAFLDAHALHANAPVLFMGGSEDERRRAAASGAERTLDAEADSRELAGVVRELLDVG